MAKTKKTAKPKGQAAPAKLAERKPMKKNVAKRPEGHIKIEHKKVYLNSVALIWLILNFMFRHQLNEVSSSCPTSLSVSSSVKSSNTSASSV